MRVFKNLRDDITFFRDPILQHVTNILRHIIIKNLLRYYESFLSRAALEEVLINLLYLTFPQCWEPKMGKKKL